MGLSLFPSFFDRPSKMRFAEQETDEHIELLLRRHWFTNVGWIITTILALLLPLLIRVLSPFFGGEEIWRASPEVVSALTILWYMLVVAYVLEEFLHWYFNIYIVTNLHIVDVNFHNLMHRDITEVRLEDIQSASSVIKGVMPPLFHFGDVLIETAAERQKIEFLAVPHPDKVTDRIQDLQALQERSRGVH